MAIGQSLGTALQARHLPVGAKGLGSPVLEAGAAEDFGFHAKIENAGLPGSAPKRREATELLSNANSMLRNGFWRWALLGCVALMGLLLRVYDVSRIFLWLDETDMFNEYVYGAHAKSLVDFALFTRDNTTVTWGWPGLIWIVSHVFGATIGTARMPTVLFSAAGVLLLFFLVYRLLPQDFPGDRYWPALFTALFASISIVQLEYAQRTYPYGAAPCLATLILLAHFQILSAASPEWKYSSRLLRALALYTGAIGIAFCVHASLVLLSAVSVALLCGSAVKGLARQSWAERWKVLRPAMAAGIILFGAALLNAKNPKYGFRGYLAEYYGTLSPGSIPKLLLHGYGLLTYQLNVVYNPALYWPERLNAVLLPLVLLCLLGWGLAARGKFGPQMKHFALLGLAATIVPAFLSLVRIFPFGGVRQLLFLSPFLLAFTSLGFYSLRALPSGRILGAALACGYAAIWAVNLPAFYAERQPVYTAGDVLAAWEQSGRLPVYSRGAERELRYELRNYPAIRVEGLSPDSKPPYLLVTTHNWIGDNRWFGDFPDYLKRSGYQATVVKQAPAWNLAAAWLSQSLYFPPNGFWVYKVTTAP